MKQRPLYLICLALVIVGAINWLLVGLAKFDLVAAIAGRRFGEVEPFNAIIYTIVGIAGLYLAIATLAAPRTGEHRSPTRMIPR